MSKSIRTKKLSKGDRIIVPDNGGTELIPVTVISAKPHNGIGDWTLYYRRDKAQGGRIDYLFTEAEEAWPRA